MPRADSADAAGASRGRGLLGALMRQERRWRTRQGQCRAIPGRACQGKPDGSANRICPSCGHVGATVMSLPRVLICSQCGHGAFLGLVGCPERAYLWDSLREKARIGRMSDVAPRGARWRRTWRSTSRPAGALNEAVPRTMFAVGVVLLNALSFASLAYVANRKGHHALAALLAAGAWLFGAASVLIWFWR
jgi:hypothetical protein